MIQQVVLDRGSLEGLTVDGEKFYEGKMPMQEGFNTTRPPFFDKNNFMY